MTVGNVNGGQNPAFVDLVNKPQAAYAYQAPQAAPLQGPSQDVYEGPRQEEKKSSFLSKALTTLVVAGALVGLNRYAHHKDAKFLKFEEGSEKFVDKYIKKPLKSVDDFVMKYYNKWFKSGEKAAGKEGGDAPKEGGETPKDDSK
jgi:hypothetical protein